VRRKRTGILNQCKTQVFYLIVYFSCYECNNNTSVLRMNNDVVQITTSATLAENDSVNKTFHSVFKN